MSTSIRVVEFTGDGSEWNAFASSVDASAFHRWEWREVLARTYRHQPLYLAAFDGSRLSGIMPLLRVRSLVFGHYLMSLPFFSYGGPVGDARSIRALCDAAVARRQGAKLLELRSRQPIATDLPVSHRKIAVVLDVIPGDFDATFKHFDGKLRSQVRRASKEGVTVHFGTDRLADFQAVYDEHMRDLGSPAHGPEFFARALAALGSLMWVGVAYLNGVPIAGGIAIENGREVEITWASSLRRYARISPNMALYGSFIQRSCERGFSAFNFGRCTPGSNTHRFKSQWGARDETLYWYQDKAVNNAALPTADQNQFQLAIRIWQRLPLAVTRAVGPKVIGWIP